jgi:NAD(P)H-dependent flavin oxidoreductase YrpB (nitropropane dioxygenase family)
MIANPSSAAEVEEVMEQARALTAGPIGIGFLVPFVATDAVDRAAALAQVVEFFFGDPDPELLRIAHAQGAITGWQVGSAAEAQAAVQAGCDYVVAQGIEGGGHVRGTQHLRDVLAETLASVDVPVLAAGGVGTAAQFDALLAAGAAAVRVGTRFVAAEEADAHPEYVSLLIAATSRDTVLTDAFATGWPDAPHRVLRSAVDAADRFEGAAVGVLGDREIPVHAALPPTRQVEGTVSAMALYAGESVDAVTRVQRAAEIVAELTAGTS